MSERPASKYEAIGCTIIIAVGIVCFTAYKIAQLFV